MHPFTSWLFFFVLSPIGSFNFGFLGFLLLAPARSIFFLFVCFCISSLLTAWCAGLSTFRFSRSLGLALHGQSPCCCCACDEYPRLVVCGCSRGRFSKGEAWARTLGVLDAEG